MKIRTRRLTLRPVRLGDEAAIHEYAGDPGITMMFRLPKESFDETAEFVKKAAAEWDSPDGTNYEFAVLYEGRIIGGCGADLGRGADRSCVTLGWIIRGDCRNRGFASEAARAVLDFAFTHLGVGKACAQCDVNNPASFAVMKKIGMRCVDDKGRRTYPGTGITSGEITCLITREEWEKRKGEGNDGLS